MRLVQISCHALSLCLDLVKHPLGLAIVGLNSMKMQRKEKRPSHVSSLSFKLFMGTSHAPQHHPPPITALNRSDSQKSKCSQRARYPVSLPNISQGWLSTPAEPAQESAAASKPN